MNTAQSQFDYITEISLGYWKSRTLITAVELGVFTCLAKGSCNAAAIAKAAKSDTRAMEMLLNALVGLEFLGKKGNLFKNRPIADQYLVKGRPLYQGNRILLSRNLWDNWSNLDKAVKSGKPVAFKNAGKKPDAKKRKVFITAMRDFAVFKSKAVAANLNLAGRNKLLDLGGGPGSYSIEFVKANPELNAVIFDLNGVVKLAKGFVKEAGLSKRIKTIAGECVNDDYGDNLYDVVFVSNLLHMYDEKINLNIINKCYNALEKGGMFIASDFFMDTSMTKSQFAALFSLNMLTGTHGGSNYSVNEIKGWLSKAGFNKLKSVKYDMDSYLVIGHK